MTRWRTAWPLLLVLLVATRAAGSPCPAPGIVTIVTDHRGRPGTVSLHVSGERIASPGECDAPGDLATSYATTLACTGPGVVRCGTIEGLAPGIWVHRVELQVASSAPQVQARQTIVLGGDASNMVDWTIFGRTFVVDAVTPLVTAIDAAAAFTAAGSLPALVRFDRAAFPGAASPVTIALQTVPGCALDTCQDDQRESAYCFEGSRITVDALDDDGLPGGVVLGIGTCNNSTLRIYGSDNVLRGLVIAGSTDGSPMEKADTMAFSGVGTRRNRLEQCVVRGPTFGDALSIEDHAGESDSGVAANVIADSEIWDAQDKGVKVVGGGLVRIERSCVHDNQHGGIQVTLGGTATVVESTIQHNLRNRPDPEEVAPEHGLLVGVPQDDQTHTNVLTTRGNVVRFNGVRGISVVNNATATLQDDVVADNYFSGLLVERTAESFTPLVTVRGSAFVCNYAPGLCENEPGEVCRANADCVLESCKPGSGGSAAKGVGVELRDPFALDTDMPPMVDLGLGGTDPGRNAFTLNANAAANPPGTNLRTDLVLPGPLPAAGDQWEHCDEPDVDPNPNRCFVAQVAELDVELGTAATAPNLGTPIGPRHGPDPVVTGVSPARPRAGDLVRVYGGLFNAIDGAACHSGALPADGCSAKNPAVAAVNDANYSQGNHVTVTIDGRAFNGPVHQVTPTMLVFEMPVDCYAAAILTVARGNDVASPAIFCDPDGCAGRAVGAPCDDHDVCTLGETCLANGTCRGVSIDCSGQCLTGTCNPVNGCVIRRASEACEDGDLCTAGDHCNGIADVCLSGAPMSCTGPCLTGECEAAVGCLPRPTTTTCDDASACTTGDHCSGSGGACVGTTVDCDDARPCTSDACDPATGCTHETLDGPSCPAADACHTAGTCVAGSCAAGAAIECADGQACTDDACDPVEGCRFVERSGLEGVTCHPTQLRSLVDALGPGVGRLGRRLANQVGCVERKVKAAGKAPSGSGAQRRQARRARKCLRRFTERVERSRLSVTQRERLTDEAASAVDAVERFFDL